MPKVTYDTRNKINVDVSSVTEPRQQRDLSLENAASIDGTARASRFLEACRSHAKLHPWAAVSLLLGLLTVLWLLSNRVFPVFTLWLSGGDAASLPPTAALPAAAISAELTASYSALELALWGGFAGFVGTSLGALPALCLRRISSKVEDTLLGFAAGMMLAACAFSLLMPALDAAQAWSQQQSYMAVAGALLVISGMMLGVLLMLGLDAFIPHEHDKTGPCGPMHEHCQRVWLFVFAIALHNIPEGMAVGVGFAPGELHRGLALALSIAIQDMPEGLAVALSLAAAGIARGKAVLIAAATGLLEPLGALLGVSLVGSVAFSYPLGLALAGGAMLFVVSHEVIPETHRHGHQTRATLGLMVGFAVMMILDHSVANAH
jgi:ZIP family zinc transporter